MHEVATSRRGAMRALAIIPAIIAAPAASAATGLVCIPATQHADWLALLAEERRLSAAFDLMVDEQEEADDRFYAACEAAEKDWQRAWEARTWPGVDRLEGQSDQEFENSVQVAVQRWNVEGEAARQQREAIRDLARQETGLAEVEGRYKAACDTHTAAIRAIIAYPSRDPDIIAQKLRVILDRFGDDSGDLRPLLASIVGEAQA
ncbi:hypothetical protein [Sphingobium cupriresistens]|uniref:Uncharacterized protein n=1 Tax=Sphingobium cupriresistens TaxID=1132417 RepID=A0A8G2DXV3_9SPHN|nr:hypothetical protein [Sphingobium cupriresistens]RYM11012.1 hypothetical protein EWH12_09905 [Sphingobium cupriresistens]